MTIALFVLPAIGIIGQLFSIATSAALVHYGRINDESVCVLEPRLHLASRTYGASNIALAGCTLITSIIGLLAMGGNKKLFAFTQNKFYKFFGKALKGLQIAVFALLLWFTILTFRGSKWALSHEEASGETMVAAFTDGVANVGEYPELGPKLATAGAVISAAFGSVFDSAAILAEPDKAAVVFAEYFDLVCTDYVPMATVLIVIWVVSGFLALLGTIGGPILGMCAMKSLMKAPAAPKAEESAAAPKAEETKAAEEPAKSSEEPAKESA